MQTLQERIEQAIEESGYAELLQDCAKEIKRLQSALRDIAKSSIHGNYAADYACKVLGRYTEGPSLLQEIERLTKQLAELQRYKDWADVQLDEDGKCIAFLEAKVEAQAAELARLNTCVVCSATLLPSTAPPHCVDCQVTEEHDADWQDALSSRTPEGKPYCAHEHLDMDGQCKACGADKRGI